MLFTITRMLLNFQDKAILNNLHGMEEALLILKLSLVSGIPLIITGKGGEGKSEIVSRFMLLFDDSVSIYKGAFNVRTSPADVLGGYDLAKMLDPKNPKVVLDVANGISQHHVALIEEAMDATAPALISMKDFLTSNEVKVGREVIKGILKWLVFVTNHNPQDFSSDASKAALMERFLVYNHSIDITDDIAKAMAVSLTKSKKISDTVIEPSISLDDILQAQELVDEMPVDDMVTGVLSRILKSRVISPRYAGYFARLLKAHAFVQGRSKVTGDDLVVAKFIAGLADSDVISDSYTEAVNAAAHQAALTKLSNIETVVAKCLATQPSSTLIHHSVRYGTIAAVIEYVQSIEVPDSTVEERSALIKSYTELLTVTLKKLRSTVVLPESIRELIKK